MIVEVVHTQWAAEGTVFQGGVHELSTAECACGVTHGKPDAELLGLIAAAEAAGSVNVLEANSQHRAKLDKAVQSQADGEAAYARAQADGRWQHGNLVQFVADREQRVAAGADLPADERALLELELADARIALEQLEEQT